MWVIWSSRPSSPASSMKSEGGIRRRRRAAHQGLEAHQRPLARLTLGCSSVAKRVRAGPAQALLHLHARGQGLAHGGGEELRAALAVLLGRYMALSAERRSAS
jgi:hypothetical protein